MVGHHSGGEGVAGWGDGDAGEDGVEEVGVCGDGVVEAALAEFEEVGVLFWSWLEWRDES